MSAQAAPPAMVAANDTTEDDTADITDTAPPPEVQRTLDAVKAVGVQAAQQDVRTLVIERYLMDQLALKEGRAPKGWVQPPFEEYCKPDAPASFIPAPPVPTTRPATVKP